MFEIEPKSRTHHRLVFGRLQGQGPSAEQIEARLTSPESCTLDLNFQLQSFVVSANLIRCTIVFSFPPYTGLSVISVSKNSALVAVRRRKLCVGMGGYSVQVVGSSVLGRGQRAWVYRKNAENVCILVFIGRFFMFSQAFAPCEYSSPLTCSRPASYIQHGRITPPPTKRLRLLKSCQFLPSIGTFLFDISNDRKP